MKVLYTAPNRGHHYRYASALDKANILYKFVSGFSRFSPRAAFPEIGTKLVRADRLQNLFLASLRFKAPVAVSSYLAFKAKIEQDKACYKYLDETDLFLYYSGSGLYSTKRMQNSGKISVVEAVNSHVGFQESLLKQEYETTGLPWKPFNPAEKERRIEEYSAADFILLPSEFVKRSFLKAGFPEEKIIKVPYGFNKLDESIRPADNANERDFNVVYVGSISVRKGLRYLIEAFRDFKHPNKKLFIVGPESQPNGIGDITIPDHVTFTGVLKGEALENIYKCATVFCLPSIEEGLALVLGEALSFGIPIIATENTGADDIITDGKEGFIVPIRNSRQILDKLEMLADDPHLYHTMRERAVNKAKSLNGWEETGQLLSRSLMDVYGKRKS